MPRQDLIAALRNAVERGETLDEAKQSLINAGYSSSDVERASQEIQKFRSRSALPPKPPKY